jgi:hypothetical protein
MAAIGSSDPLNGVRQELEALAGVGPESPLPSPSRPEPMAASGIHEIALTS